MPVFKTSFSGYSVKFSPFHESRLAVATAQNYAITGKGRVHVLQSNTAITEVASFGTADAVFDLCWSESHESQLIAAVGDGFLEIYDLSVPPASNPIRSLREHCREVHAVDFNPVRKDSFLSASWDKTVKLWNVDRTTSMRTFEEHEYCVQSAAWRPRQADMFASVSDDCTLRIWDLREPESVIIHSAHDSEILSCDWNKQDDCIIATASFNREIKVWDVRSLKDPVADIDARGGNAVRKVKFSPHKMSILASCSCDKAICMWDYMAENALIQKYDHHNEFAVSVDMSVLVDGLLASTGWDELVFVWQQGTDPKAP